MLLSSGLDAYLEKRGQIVSVCEGGSLRIFEWERILSQQKSGQCEPTFQGVRDSLTFVRFKVEVGW